MAYAADEGNEDCAKIMEILKGLPKKERDEVMPERLCELSGVKPSDLVGAVCSQVWALQNGESAMAASILHPEIIRRTAKAAMNLKYGGRDRELFLRATGSLPDRKGTTIINNNNPQIANLGPGVAAGQLPSMERAALDMDKLLEAPIDVLPARG